MTTFFVFCLCFLRFWRFWGLIILASSWLKSLFLWASSLLNPAIILVSSRFSASSWYHPGGFASKIKKTWFFKATPYHPGIILCLRPAHHLLWASSLHNPAFILVSSRFSASYWHHPRHHTGPGWPWGLVIILVSSWVLWAGDVSLRNHPYIILPSS